MRTVLQSKLKIIARGVVARQHPFLVGVTGSVGKTSTKRAIVAVLAVQGSVRADEKNYNNEIGLPVAIIGGVAPGHSTARWLSLLARGAWRSCVRDAKYPATLVLEYGADHPGDLDYLLSVARPQIAVVTAIGPAHTAFFANVEGVVVEKQKLITALSTDGVAVLNRDDERVFGMRSRTKTRVITYGFHAEAEVRGLEYQITQSPSDSPSASGGFMIGIALKIQAQGSVVPLHLTGCVGIGHASAALAAAAVGLSRGMNLVDISHALESYVPPPSRLRVLNGIKRTTLLDDAYNSSPAAAVIAIDAAKAIAVPGRRIAVLGDMLELGALTEDEHAKIGARVAEVGMDYLVTVGEASRHTASAARAAGMPVDRTVEFANATDAGRHVQDLLRTGDLVLVKGSQGMRMERVVVELMAEPLRKSGLVCRQDAEWLTRP